MCAAVAYPNPMGHNVYGAGEGFFMGMPAQSAPTWHGSVACPPPAWYASGPCGHQALGQGALTPPPPPAGYPQVDLVGSSSSLDSVRTSKPGAVVFELANIVPEPLSVLTPPSPPPSPPRIPPPTCPAPTLDAPELPSPPTSDPVTPLPAILTKTIAGDPHGLASSAELSAMIVEHLEGSCDARGAIFEWLRPVTLELALSTCGCRVVQKALEVAGGPDRASLVEFFRTHVNELVLSPNGNHVLQKCIEVMPPGTVQFIVEELTAFPGGWLALSQHCFGCRVAERLLEHCPEEHTAPIVAEVIANVQTLCRHPYGNYVVQHALEYSSSELRVQIITAMAEDPDIGNLAQHRMASHVIERVLDLSDAEGRQVLVRAILAEPFALIRMACSRCGSFLTQRLLELPLDGSQGVEVFRQLREGVEQLKASKHGKPLAKQIEELSNPPAQMFYVS